MVWASHWTAAAAQTLTLTEVAALVANAGGLDVLLHGSRSGNHAAIEHPICDRRRNLVDELEFH